MKTLYLVCVAVSLITSPLHAGIKTQTSWFLGPVEPGPVVDWGEEFSYSEHVAYSLPGQVSLLSEGVDYDAWEMRIIEENPRILGRANILPADINGDGYRDLVGVIGGDPGWVVWYEYDEYKDPSERYVKHTIDFFDNLIGTVWPCDLDNDGDFDVVASGAVGPNGGLVWFENRLVPDSSVTFFRNVIDDTSYTGYQYARPGDVDNDGDIDIVVHDLRYGPEDCGDLWLFRNEGYQGSELVFVRELIYLTTSYNIWRINLGDLTGDGYLDIQTSWPYIMVFLNKGDEDPGVFSSQPDYTYSQGPWIDGSWLADFNADGDLDILGGRMAGVFWLENDPDDDGSKGKVFAYHDIGGHNGYYGDQCMGSDMNLDGFMDALSGYRYVGWFEQLPDSSFVERQFPEYLHDVHWVYGEDLDGAPCDGDIDIDVLASNYGQPGQDGQFLWWENEMVIFYEQGELISSILDAQFRAEWISFGWDDCEPDSFENSYYVRSGTDVDSLQSSTWLGPIEVSGDTLEDYGVADGRYFQYKQVMKRLPGGDDDRSPLIYEARVKFEEADLCDPIEPWLVRTQGYWRRQCKHDPHEDICSHVDSVHGLADLFDAFDCDSICNLMRVSSPERDMCRKARRQFMGLLLNIASGKLAVCNCLEDGREVGDVVVEIDSLLSGNPDHAACVYAKTLADDLNNGLGIVPCDTLWAPAPPKAVVPPGLSVSPNPFVTRTVIQYELKTPGHVRLQIYGKAGRLVRTLVNGEQARGSYSIEWNGLNEAGERVPTGIYFSRVQVGSSVASGKLILLR